jgi:hypothetical protein
MSTEEKSPVYAVFILRTDQNHIQAIESEDYDKCYEKWQELTNLWQESVKEEKPFVLKEPKVTCFTPILIKEITLVPVVEQQFTKNNNPYQKEMVQSGFSSTLQKYSGGRAVEAVHPYLTDQGYK